jgi:hypothetical protein
MPGGVGKEAPQTADAQCVELYTRPPLARLELAQALDARMPLQSLMQRKEPSGNEPRPRITAGVHVAK